MQQSFLFKISDSGLQVYWWLARLVKIELHFFKKLQIQLIAAHNLHIYNNNCLLNSTGQPNICIEQMSSISFIVILILTLILIVIECLNHNRLCIGSPMKILI